jgi:hypothetical protein
MNVGTLSRTERDEASLIDRRTRENGVLRRVVGLLTAIPIPGLAYALSAANVAAVATLGLRTAAGWPRYTRAIIAWSLLGAAVTMASALVQDAAIANLVVISTLSFALLVAGFVKITDGVETGVHLLLWASIAMIGFFLIIGAENTRDTFEHLWKYGIAVPIAMLVMAEVTRASNRRLWPVVALLGIGALSVALGFRSHGLVCVAVVLLLLAKGTSKSRGRAFFKVLFAVALFYAAWVTVPAAISSGVFGEGVRMRTEEQLTSGASPLLSGRVEPPLSIAAILARPVFGWGHLNEIDLPTIAHGQQIAADLGLVNPVSYMNLWVRRDGRVSVHSVLFEAWVQGGIIAAVGPLLIIVLFATAIIRTSGKWAPIVLLVSVQGIWDVLFSTWGAQRPTVLAVSVVIAAWAVMIERPRDANIPTSRQARGSGARFAPR